MCVRELYMFVCVCVCAGCGGVASVIKSVRATARAKSQERPCCQTAGRLMVCLQYKPGLMHEQ